MNNTEISVVEAVRIAMDAYDRLRAKWALDHATTEGFDAWFTTVIMDGAAGNAATK